MGCILKTFSISGERKFESRHSKYIFCHLILRNAMKMIIYIFSEQIINFYGGLVWFFYVKII